MQCPEQISKWEGTFRKVDNRCVLVFGTQRTTLDELPVHEDRVVPHENRFMYLKGMSEMLEGGYSDLP